MLTLGTGLYALAMLGLVLGLILGLAWALRTYGGRFGLMGATTGQQPTLKVTQRLPLTPQHTLVEITDTTHRTLLVLGSNHSTVVSQHPLKRTK